MKEALLIFVIALAIGSFLNSQGGLGGLLSMGARPQTIETVTPSGDTPTTPTVSKVPDVKDANFETEVLQSSKPVLVDFYTPWCGPCKIVAPIVERVAERYGTTLKVVKMNTDDNQTIAEKYQINSIPRLYIFKGGKLVETIEGAAPESEIVALVEKTLALDPTPTR